MAGIKKRGRRKILFDLDREAYTVPIIIASRKAEIDG